MRPNPNHRQKLGAEGSCVCPKCAHKMAHQAGVPCQQESCPECGAKMLREGSSHYDMWQRKQATKAIS